LVLQQGLGAVM